SGTAREPRTVLERLPETLPDRRRQSYDKVRKSSVDVQSSWRHSAFVVGVSEADLHHMNSQENPMKRSCAFRIAMAIIAATLLLAAASGVTRPLDAQTSTSIFQATLAESNQGTGEVSTDELQRILRDRSATVFDARPPREYAISHIPGAINVVGKLGLPASQYVADAAEIERVLAANKSAAVVLYCSGPFCGRSKRLSEELVKAGFTNV